MHMHLFRIKAMVFVFCVSLVLPAGNVLALVKTPSFDSYYEYFHSDAENPPSIMFGIMPQDLAGQNFYGIEIPLKTKNLELPVPFSADVSVNLQGWSRGEWMCTIDTNTATCKGDMPMRANEKTLIALYFNNDFASADYLLAKVLDKSGAAKLSIGVGVKKDGKTPAVSAPQKITPPAPTVVKVTPKSAPAKVVPQPKPRLFRKNLSVGSQGVDVKELQQFLFREKFLAKAEDKSNPKKKDYFGKTTKSALSKFQKYQGVKKVSGVFDTATRMVVNELLSYSADGTCSGEYSERRGGGVVTDARFPTKDSYKYERKDLQILNQNDYGSETCMLVTAAASFDWLDKTYKTKMIEEKSVAGAIEELKTSTGWDSKAGTNSTEAVKGVAKYISDHNAAGSYQIEFFTEAPRGKGFAPDALDGKKELSGVALEMNRRQIKGRDVYAQMKKGQDVIIGIKKHVFEVYGIDEADRNGNYPAAIYDPALGKVLGGSITITGKVEFGDVLTDIQEMIAVSPKK